MPTIDDFMPRVSREGYTPTPEQEAIVTDVKSTKNNLLISALAGAAKTSTLVLIADALPTTGMLCLAFNKRIAVEMEKRLPSTCKAKTLNSLGHSAWAQFLNKRFLTVDDKKTYRIVRKIIEDLDVSEKERGELFKKMSDLMRAVDYGKTAGYIPDGHYPHAKPLMDDEEFFSDLDEEPTKLEFDIIRGATLISLQEAHEGNIDFADQLLCPTVFPASFTQWPVTLVDEAQDLSALNHAMLHKVVGKKRIIAVGDACQSIYGFRGAHEDSMAKLKEEFSMTEYILSISFRCPISVVKEAQWRAPHMRWPDFAKEGKVSALGVWGVDDIPENSAIICRNNAPLFSLAFKLLKQGRYPELVGNDLGKTLIKILKGLGKPELKREQVLEAIGAWKATKMEKARNKSKVQDQADCLTIFARQGKNLGEAIIYAETILNASGPVKLMTGHKSKGLEFENVFFLDQSLVGDEQQEKNLRYVIQTRAKATLTYVNSDTFIFPEEELSNE